MTPQEIFASVIWKCIPSDDDVTWIDRVARPAISKSPLGDYGAIVHEMRDKGVSDETIARFAKIVGYETAFGICYALDGPDLDEADNPDPIAWGLFLVDADTAEPIEQLSCSHELLLSKDPSGNEMNPPKRTLAKSSRNHHTAHISKQSKLRGRWLNYYTKCHFRSFEINTDLLPTSIEPMWPGRRVGVLLASNDTDTWLMSDGLSNIKHPLDDENWDRVVSSYSPEIVSRVPANNLSPMSKSEELAQNPAIQLFLTLACLCLKLHSERMFTEQDHIFSALDIDVTGNVNDTVSDSMVLFSNAESLQLAEPVQLPDHDYLRVQVLFATLVNQVDETRTEMDASVLSRTLLQNGQLGVLVPRNDSK